MRHVIGLGLHIHPVHISISAISFIVVVEGECYLRNWTTINCDPIPCWAIVSFKLLSPSMRAGLPIQSLEATITVKVLKGSENHRNAEVLAAIRRLLEVHYSTEHFL